MADEVAVATGDAEPNSAEAIIKALSAKRAASVQQARVTLTIELENLNPDVITALQLFVTSAVGGGLAVGASSVAGFKSDGTLAKLSDRVGDSPAAKAGDGSSGASLAKTVDKASR